MMDVFDTSLTRFKSKRRDSTCLVLPKLTEMTQSIIDNNIETVRWLISKQEFIDYTDLKGRTYLHLASYFGTIEIANLLIKAGISVDKRDNDWLTPLHISCFLNKSEVTKLLLNFGADINPRDRSWCTPLHYCASNNSTDCLNLLISKNKLGLDLKNIKGATALHYAAYHGSISVCSMLIQNNASICIKDNKQRTCLHYAATQHDPSILLLLLKENIFIDEKDENGLTALHIACGSGKVNCIKTLIKYGANVNEVDLNLNIPLHYACLFGSVEIIKILIEAGSNIFCKNNYKLTPFHFSINQYETDALSYILLTHPAIDINFQDFHGRTALHFAVSFNNLKKVNLLIENNADVNIRDKLGRTALHYAVSNNFTDIIEKLLEVNPRGVNLLDNNRLSPFHYAAASNDAVTWRLIKNENSNCDLKDLYGRTVHFYATTNKLFLRSILPLPTFLDDYKRSLLHYAALSKEIDCLEYLLDSNDNKFDINGKDILGRTCLHYAAMNDSYGFSIKLLLKKKMILNICDKYGLYPLNYAAIYDKVENLEELLNFNERYNNLICPTYCASYYGSLNCLKYLLNKKFYSDLIKSLEYATFSGHLDCVQLLLYHITKSKQLDQLFNSKVLHIAILKSHKECFDSIMVNLERSEFKDNQGRTSLMMALANNKEKKFCDILESICDKNSLDKFNRNILFYCVYYKNIEKAKQYLYSLEKPLKKCNSGQTPLHLAAKMDYFEMVEIILQYLNSKRLNITYEYMFDNDYYNPLHWACYKGNYKTVEVFLKYTKSKSFVQISKNNVTLLHLACFSGDYNCIELILNFFDKSYFSITDYKNQNAFHYLFMSKSIINTKIIDLLVKHNIDLNCRDFLNRTPFLLAIKNQHLDCCDLLLNYKINLNFQDFNGNNCLHYACHYKAEEIGIKLILKNVDLIDIQNKFYKTALHLAASNGLFNLTKELLSAGACYNIQDMNGFTPSLSCAKNDDVADCLQILIDTILFDKKLNNSSSIELDKSCVQCSSPIRGEKRSFLISKMRKTSSLFSKNNDSSSLSIIKNSNDSE